MSFNAAVVIPAKGTSERVTCKNLREIEGLPLVKIAVNKAISADVFDKIYVDTESAEVWDAVREMECTRMYRPKSLADNSTDGNGLLRWEYQAGLKHYKLMFQLNCTSPLIRADTIANVVKTFHYKLNQFDSVLTVIPRQEYYWTNGIPNYNLVQIPNGVDMPVHLQETHALYGIRSDSFAMLGTRVGQYPLLYETTELEAYDINTPEDLDIVRCLAKNLCGHHI